MTTRETGAVEILKRELERQKVPFARCASENVVFIYNSPALDLAAMAAALSRPQPTPSATGEIVAGDRDERARALHDKLTGTKLVAWCDETRAYWLGRLDALEQQAATIEGAKRALKRADEIREGQAATIAELREALEWYAEQAEGCRKLGYIGDPFRRALDADGGKRARATLKRTRGQ